MILIETDRLIIRDHVQDDLEDLHSLLSDDIVMNFIQDLKTNTLEESRNNLIVSINESKSSERSKYFFAIIDKSSNQYVGEIGVTEIYNCIYGKRYELGYFTHKKFWGYGIVTEAANAVINYCFEKLNALKIVAGCNKENGASEEVMIKLGMIKEAVFKNHVVLNGELCDRVEYRLLKNEWNRNMKGKKF